MAACSLLGMLALVITDAILQEPVKPMSGAQPADAATPAEIDVKKAA